ncbi:MAG: hypothetical protein EBY18_12830 [Alphaproteobacteria bacterium]|nr:hypothetical protein [Alphaproteobacteria bacterium]
MTRFVLAALVMICAGSVAAQTKTNPANAPGAPDSKVRLQTLGYRDIHDLRRGPDGQWTAKATRGNTEKSVTAKPDGSVIAR